MSSCSILYFNFKPCISFLHDILKFDATYNNMAYILKSETLLFHGMLLQLDLGFSGRGMFGQGLGMKMQVVTGKKSMRWLLMGGNLVSYFS